jgi:hypothetical protein
MCTLNTHTHDAFFFKEEKRFSFWFKLLSTILFYFILFLIIIRNPLIFSFLFLIYDTHFFFYNIFFLIYLDTFFYFFFFFKYFFISFYQITYNNNYCLFFITYIRNILLNTILAFALIILRHQK